MNSNLFRAGAARVDSTPPLGTFINGDFIAHYARYIHDRLYVKALVMEKGNTLLAIVVVDICGMNKDFLDAIKATICGQTGIPVGNILISSTHTHAAGAVAANLLSAPDLLYRQKLPGLIVKAVGEAWQNLRPAQVAFGSVDVPEHVVCRRYFMKEGYRAPNPVTGQTDRVKTNPFGDEQQIDRPVAPMDTQVAFFAVKGIDDRWISLLGNYSLHYVGDWENGTISADYFGVFSEETARLLGAGEDFVGMMSNGTSGNANIWDFMNPGRYPDAPFEKSKLIGTDIARRVVEQLPGCIWQENPDLAAVYEEFPVDTRKPSAGELEQAAKVVAEADYENLKRLDADGLAKLYAREQIMLNELPDILQLPIQVLKIGNGSIGGLAGEFFAETGLKLKENSRTKHYFTIGLANGGVGYVPPAHEFELGGYETWRCRTSFLAFDAEHLIRNRLLQLQRELV